MYTLATSSLYWGTGNTSSDGQGQMAHICRKGYKIGQYSHWPMQQTSGDQQNHYSDSCADTCTEDADKGIRISVCDK